MTSLSVLMVKGLKHQSISVKLNRNWRNDNELFLEPKKEAMDMKKLVGKLPGVIRK